MQFCQGTKLLATKYVMHVVSCTKILLYWNSHRLLLLLLLLLFYKSHRLLLLLLLYYKSHRLLIIGDRESLKTQQNLTTFSKHPHFELWVPK